MEEDSEDVTTEKSSETNFARICANIVVGLFGLWALVGLSYCATGDITNNSKLEETGWNITTPLMWIMLAFLIIGAVINCTIDSPEARNEEKR